MNWTKYILIFLVICFIWFIVTRIWVAGIDMILSVLKKSFGFKEKNNTKSWHTLKDIRDKNETMK